MIEPLEIKKENIMGDTELTVCLGHPDIWVTGTSEINALIALDEKVIDLMQRLTGLRALIHDCRVELKDPVILRQIELQQITGIMFGLNNGKELCDKPNCPGVEKCSCKYNVK